MRRLLITLIAAGALLTPVAASATAQEQVAGTFQVESLVVTRAVPVGTGCYVSLTATFSFAGPLRGSFTAPFAIWHDGPCSEPAPETFLAGGTFDGAVAVGGTERSGSFRFSFVGTIDAAGNARGWLVVRHGTGGLAGLRGIVELTGVTGVGGTYQGRIHLHTAR